MHSSTHIHTHLLRLHSYTYTSTKINVDENVTRMIKGILNVDNKEIKV